MSSKTDDNDPDEMSPELLDALNVKMDDADRAEAALLLGDGSRDDATLSRMVQAASDPQARYTHSPLPLSVQKKFLAENARATWDGNLDAAEAAVGFAKTGRADSDLTMLGAWALGSLMKFHLADSSEENERTALRRLQGVQSVALGAWEVWNGEPSSAKEASSWRDALSGVFSVGAGDNDPLQTLRDRLWEELSPDEIARATLEAASTLAFVPFCLSGLYFRSGQKTDLVRGAYQLRKSWKAFERAEHLARRYEVEGRSLDPNMRSLVRLGVGAFHFFVSLVPNTFLWVVQLIGFEADRGSALAELEKARQEENCVRHVEVTLLLAVIKHFFQGETEVATQLVEGVIAEYPDSALLPPVTAGLCRLRGDVEGAIASYTLSIDRSHLLPHFRVMQFYHRGTCGAFLWHWEEAASDLAFFLENTGGKQFKPFAGFLLGLSLWHLGKKSEVRALYEQIPGWCRPNQSYDAFATRKAQTFLAADGFSEFDETYLAVYALHHGFQFERALQEMQRLVPLLKKMGTSQDNRDCHAQFYWIKGSCLKGLALGPDGKVRDASHIARARAFLTKATQQREFVKDETYVVPYAWFELGELEAAEGNFERAQEIWQFVQKSFSKYDWEKILFTRMKSASDRATARSKA